MIKVYNKIIKICCVCCYATQDFTDAPRKSICSCDFDVTSETFTGTCKTHGTGPFIGVVFERTL